jgi:hypothetical protein
MPVSRQQRRRRRSDTFTVPEAGKRLKIGRNRTAWVADYLDQSGKRHQQAFPTRGAAGAFLAQALGEVAKGIHTPTTTSITVAAACQLWLEKCA